jgi:hypothetical protein
MEVINLELVLADMAQVSSKAGLRIVVKQAQISSKERDMEVINLELVLAMALLRLYEGSMKALLTLYEGAIKAL